MHNGEYARLTCSQHGQRLLPAAAYKHCSLPRVVGRNYRFTPLGLGHTKGLAGGRHGPPGVIGGLVHNPYSDAN
jgi:hypothetical protein